MLNGKVEFTKHSKNRDFKGFLKMNKDPKGEDVNIENMIYRGSVLKYTEWLYGMVIFAGLDCKIFKYTKVIKADKFKSFFGSKAKIFYLIAYVQVIVSAFVKIFNFFFIITFFIIL